MQAPKTKVCTHRNPIGGAANPLIEGFSPPLRVGRRQRARDTTKPRRTPGRRMRVAPYDTGAAILEHIAQLLGTMNR